MYLIFGFLTTALAFFIYQVCFALGLRSATIANTIASVIAVVFAYFTNKAWVFQSKNYEPRVLLREMAAFFSGRAFTWFVETALLFVLVDLAKLHETYCKIGTSVIVIILNYLISKKAVFKK
jgi:putative flippase GtrA